MRELKGLGNKKYWNTYSKIHQIASAAGKLASKISGNFSASGQKVLLSWMWPVERSKKKKEIFSLGKGLKLFEPLKA